MDRNVDFPTLGNPSSPTSAINFNSKVTILSSPGAPGFENLGTCLVAVAKWAFPQPPIPPFAITNSSPSCFKSHITSPVFSSLTIVPTGTLILRCSPFLPFLFASLPFPPFSAANFLLYLKSTSVLTFLSATKMTFPPFPPSPPSGPPAATYFSR